MTINGLFKTNRLRFVGIILAFLLSSLMMVINSYLLMYLVEFLKSHDLHHWLEVFGLDLVVSLASYLFPRLSNYLLQKQLQDYNHEIRQKIVGYYYTKEQAVDIAKVQNHLINDLNIVNSAYLSNFFFIISDAATTVISAVVLLSLHWALLLVTFVIVGLSLWLPQLLNQRLTKATNRLSSTNEQYLSLLQGWLTGIDELRRYLAGDKLFDVLKHSQAKLGKANVNYQEKAQTIAMINGFSSNLFSLAIYVVAGILIQKQLILFGTLVAIGNFHYYISGAMEDINYSLQEMRGSRELNGQIQTQVQTEIVKAKKTNKPCAIKLSKAKFYYGKKLIAFPDITIESGEKVLLTAPNGRGKSTLLDILAGRKNLFNGQMIFSDNLGHKIKNEQVQINYMTQKAKIYPGNYLDNITMFDPKYAQKAQELVKKLDLKLEQDNQEFSGGQEQILVILRHMIHPSSLILIDEGLSGVDDARKEKLLEYLQALPVTLILVEHNLNPKLESYFDRKLAL